MVDLICMDAKRLQEFSFIVFSSLLVFYLSNCKGNWLRRTKNYIFYPFVFNLT